jgi:hypothetical protein
VPAFFFSFTPNTLFFFFSKNSGINPGQPAEKGREKKQKNLHRSRHRKLCQNCHVTDGQTDKAFNYSN